jgi:hypothetical protein
MIDPQELAEAAFFGEDGTVEVREDVSSERVVDGELQEIDGVEYKFGAPCDVGAVFQAIEDDDDTVVLEASVSDKGMLCCFCPYPSDRSGNLWDSRSANERF